jgi:hypothetical protein
MTLLRRIGALTARNRFASPAINRVVAVPKEFAQVDVRGE